MEENRLASIEAKLDVLLAELERWRPALERLAATPSMAAWAARRRAAKGQP